MPPEATPKIKKPVTVRIPDDIETQTNKWIADRPGATKELLYEKALREFFKLKKENPYDPRNEREQDMADLAVAFTRHEKGQRESPVTTLERLLTKYLK